MQAPPGVPGLVGDRAFQRLEDPVDGRERSGVSCAHQQAVGSTNHVEVRLGNGRASSDGLNQVSHFDSAPRFLGGPFSDACPSSSGSPPFNPFSEL